MNVVIPISTADVSIASVFFRVLNLMGPYPCPAYLVCSSATREDAEKYASEISASFKAVHIWEIASPDTGHSWPKNPNRWFGEVALRIYREPSFVGSWLWCELDSVPMRKNWIESLFHDSRLAGKSFWGGGRKLDERGTMVDYIVGCMIYPKDVWATTSLKYAVSSDIAWDVYCRYEFLFKGGITHKIHHNWRTTNYKVSPEGSAMWDETDPLSQSSMWPEDVLLIHGCKDGSLAKALYFPKEVPRIPDRPVQKPTEILFSSPEIPKTPDKPRPRAKRRAIRKKKATFLLTPPSS